MSRLMSVAMTTDAVVERRKTVTRRKGWTFLKPGERITLCRKVQGRKPGEGVAAAMGAPTLFDLVESQAS